MKFIPVFLSAITQARLGQAKPWGRSRIPGKRNPPGTKLSRMAASNVLTKRGRT